MQQENYQFRPGAQAPGGKAAAAKVAAELKRIQRAHRGKLHPSDVVQAARGRRSPLHGYFTWDDTKAADLRRLDEARRLIHSVRVELIDSDTGHKYMTRAHVNLRRGREAPEPYRDIVDVMSDEALRARLVDNALAEAESWMRRYEQLKELADVFEAIRAARTRGSRKKTAKKKTKKKARTRRTG